MVQQLIEDVRTFAGQTVTISFWAKADTTRSVTTLMRQYFGSGGSPSAAVDTASQANSLTTSWQRFTQTVAIPSISGKTIGTNPDSSLQLHLYLPITAGSTIDIWGVQVEAGSVATAFQTATGTLQGELAAAQRYFYRNTGQAAAPNDLGTGWCNSTTSAVVIFRHPVTMRVAPTATLSAQTDFGFTWSLGTSTISASQVDRTSPDSVYFRLTTTGLTTGQGGVATISTGTTKYIEMSAEL